MVTNGKNDVNGRSSWFSVRLRWYRLSSLLIFEPAGGMVRRPAREFSSIDLAERPRRSDYYRHRNRVHGEVGRRGVETGCPSSCRCLSTCCPSSCQCLSTCCPCSCRRRTPAQRRQRQTRWRPPAKTDANGRSSWFSVRLRWYRLSSLLIRTGRRNGYTPGTRIFQHRLPSARAAATTIATATACTARSVAEASKQ